MTDTYKAWVEEERPIYSRLPGSNGGYTENEVADWLTDYWDELLVATKDKIDDLPRQLDPLTCDAEWLDFLAVLAGFTGKFGIANYPESTKRVLIANSFGFIWPNRGSQAVLEFVLNSLGLEFIIWRGSVFLAGITLLPSTITDETLNYFVLVPINYLRTGELFNLVEQVNELYKPAYVKSRVAYDAFYAGFSTAGDPTFYTPQLSS